MNLKNIYLFNLSHIRCLYFSFFLSLFIYSFTHLLSDLLNLFVCILIHLSFDLLFRSGVELLQQRLSARCKQYRLVEERRCASAGRVCSPISSTNACCPPRPKPIPSSNTIARFQKHDGNNYREQSGSVLQLRTWNRLRAGGQHVHIYYCSKCTAVFMTWVIIWPEWNIWNENVALFERP